MSTIGLYTTSMAANACENSEQLFQLRLCCCVAGAVYIFAVLGIIHFVSMVVVHVH